MSILSDTDLLALHASTGQPVTPFLHCLHKPEPGGPSFGLSSAGYDVRLSNQIAGYWGYPSQPIDPTDPDHLTRLEERVWRRTNMPKYILEPGEFILAATEEIFDMPDDVIGCVTDKSTWARLGVCVQNTVIEPSWQGRLVLEITNHNRLPVVLTVGVGIAQIVFERLESPPTVTYRDRGGKYMNQTGITLPR